MSDKKPSKDTLLKKKSSRKKRAVSKMDKEVDIEKVKELIQKEMTNLKDRNPINNFPHNINDLRSSSSSLSEYDLKYKKYLQEEFSYNHFVIINRTISDSEKCPVELRNNYALHKYLYNTVKTLLMNELEIVYFSIFLDNLGWATKEFDLEENLLMTGISVKIYLNTNYNFIIEFLKNKNNDINDRFNTWLSHKKDYESILKIHPRDLNERFYKLKKPFNSHCKVNYVDYNCVVDQILQMSLPYCDTKTTSTHVNKHNYNTLNNASNLSYSVKEEKQSDKNLRYTQNQYDNTVKGVLEQAEMSPVSQIKVEDQRFLSSNNANNHTQNFVKTLNSNHSISFHPSQNSNINSNLNQSINLNTNMTSIQQTIQDNPNAPKIDINDFNIRKFDSNASFGLFNESSNIPNYLMSNDFGALYSRMQSQNIGLNEEEYRNNFFKGMSRYNFDVPRNIHNHEHDIVNIESIKKETETEFKSQDFSFQEQISFEAKNKDNQIKQDEVKEPVKNPSVFTKTENNNHNLKTSGLSDKKDSMPTKTYKLDLKSSDNKKTFGNPFNKNAGFFNNNNNNNPSNIKNNIVLINNTSNDQKDNKLSNHEAKPANNSNNNNNKDNSNNRNQNNLKKNESVSQFYN